MPLALALALLIRLLERSWFLLLMELFIHVEDGHVLLYAFLHLLFLLHLLQLLSREQGPITVLGLAQSKLEVAIVVILESVLQFCYFIKLFMSVRDEVEDFSQEVHAWSTHHLLLGELLLLFENGSVRGADFWSVHDLA